MGYAKIFATGHFMSACRRWNEKPSIEKTWSQFKAHFAAAHRQHNKMQGESSAASGHHFLIPWSPSSWSVVDPKKYWAYKVFCI
jgi:hypothetical protein